ncbi:hypothetical protein CVV65_06480 [Kyrpidia spormannii]|uniref:Uncharacterized protein n=1 Tax=Kyrpidia spormannii TaxID=2055160 RepID=A0A2K8N5M0_9BACL|nr:hypothetical protein CVV65_06480 [Kyrpidia spormannii]
MGPMVSMVDIFGGAPGFTFANVIFVTVGWDDQRVQTTYDKPMAQRGREKCGRGAGWRSAPPVN